MLHRSLALARIEHRFLDVSTLKANMVSTLYELSNTDLLRPFFQHSPKTEPHRCIPVLALNSCRGECFIHVPFVNIKNA